MYQKFQDIVAAAQQRSPKRVIAIAAAADERWFTLPRPSRIWSCAT